LKVDNNKGTTSIILKLRVLDHSIPHFGLILSIHLKIPQSYILPMEFPIMSKAYHQKTSPL
ncbi:hypothetical protein B4903_17435, partial [Yersinia frederiksenii]